MNIVKDYLRGLYDAAISGWDRFWFTPTDPATYCLIRVFAGLMLLYTHAVWTLDFDAFFGPNPWLPAEVISRGEVNELLNLDEGTFRWSHFHWISSPALLWTIHWCALGVLAMFTLGLFSRVTSVLSFLITVSYIHRIPAAQFGLDDINGFLALYLIVGPSGACYSLDRLIARWRSGGKVPPVQSSHAANIGIRLIQLHMCVVYLFAGLAKLQGNSWWNGTAMWLSVANYEYQSIDMTWLASWPTTLNVMTHLAVWWEASYCFLVWPRWTRPIVIALAVPMHLGIACFLGMMTFGLVMLIGNLAFVSPNLVRSVVRWPFSRAAMEGATVRSMPAQARKKAGQRLGA